MLPAECACWAQHSFTDQIEACAEQCNAVLHSGRYTCQTEMYAVHAETQAAVPVKAEGQPRAQCRVVLQHSNIWRLQSATRGNNVPSATGQLTMWAIMMRPVTSSALLPPYILAMATAEQDIKLKIACISRGGGRNLCAGDSFTGTGSIAPLACWPMPCQQDLKALCH